MRRAAAVVWLFLGVGIGVTLHTGLEERSSEPGPRTSVGNRSDPPSPLAGPASATDREVASAPIASRSPEEPPSEASDPARGAWRPAAGSTSPRPRAECELLVLDERGTEAESAEILVQWHDDPTSFEERLAWSQKDRRFSLPTGPVTLVASRGAGLRSDERWVNRLENEAPRTITLTLMPNSELVGHVRLPESELPTGFEVILHTVPREDLPELTALVASETFRSGDAAARTWLAAGATSFRLDRLDPGRRLLVLLRGDLVAASQIVELAPGRNEVAVEVLPIPDSRRFELRVRDPSGRPINDLSFDLRQEADGNGGGSWSFETSATQLLPDGTLRLCTTEAMERMLANAGARRITLSVRAPNHATESIPVGPGQRRFDVVLREERLEAFVVEFRGLSTSPYRELFVAEFRREHGRSGWSSQRGRVPSNGILVVDRIRPGRYTLVVHVHAADFLPLVTILRHEVTIDSANARATIDVPPILELAVRVAGTWPDGDVNLVEELPEDDQARERINLTSPIGPDGRTIFRTLPLGRYRVECGDASTTIDLERSSEVTLSPKRVEPSDR